METFGSSSQKPHKSRYQTFLILSSFTGVLYFVPNILPRIVGVLFSAVVRALVAGKLVILDISPSTSFI